MTPEIKELLGELKTKLGEVDQVTGAVAQLEEQVKGLPATMEKKIKAIAARTYGDGGRYRGVFPTEDNARSFGLAMIAKTYKPQWAADALKSEFPGVAKDFAVADADAVLPEEWSSTIVSLMEDYSVFERNATTWPMAENTTNYPKKTGRTAAVPMDAGTSVAQTKPTLVKKQLNARKWGAYTEVPNEVTEDSSVVIGELIASDMAEAHAQAADEAGFLGDGTSTYNSITGVVNALVPGAIVTGAGAAWSDLTLDDFTAVIALPVQKAFAGGSAMPKWYCSHQFFWTVMVPLMLSKGGVTAAEVQGQRSLMFAGFPVEILQVMPATSAASQIPVVFGNLRRGAVFGSRGGLRVRTSADFKFDEDTLAILSTRRFDIQVHGAGLAGVDDAPDTVEVLAALKTDAE